jgi:hypothetical protein
MRELLEACGALRYPRPVAAPNALSYDERTEVRREAGHEQTSGINDKIDDWVLQGFEELVEVLPKLEPEGRAERTRLIWESLGDLEERRGRGIFDGLYRWSHYGSYKKDFPSAFVRRLNDTAWVPDENGDLQPPSQVIFDTLGWKANPFLLTKIAFKPPIIDQLAKEAGIDPAALDLLRKLGITSVADLTSRLGITEQPSEQESGFQLEPEGQTTSADEADVYQDAKDLYGDDMPDIPAGTYDPDGGDAIGKRGTSSGRSRGNGNADSHSGGGVGKKGAAAADSAGGRGDTTKVSGGPGKRTPGSEGRRPFISYVGSHPSEEESDPDGLDHGMRMEIEGKAINAILLLESSLRKTAEGNKGFDLYELDATGKPSRWVEVKSMTGSLEDRPVGMSRAQFDFAREKGDAYWLYVVEYASDVERERILRIQDPVGHARTFTFDHGWVAVAQLHSDYQSSVSNSPANP